MEQVTIQKQDFDFLSNSLYVIFGGTFDPPHLGHLNIALSIVSQLDFDVVFMPNGNINYKNSPIASNLQRLELLDIILSYNTKFYLSSLEIMSQDLCFTYKTISKIRTIVGNNRPLFFVIGSDSLITLDSWDNWQQLITLTNFIIIKRPSFAININNLILKQIFQTNLYHDINQFKHSVANGFFCLDVQPCDISSTKIRQKCSLNQPIDNLVPRQIKDYILTNNLYR